MCEYEGVLPIKPSEWVIKPILLDHRNTIKSSITTNCERKPPLGYKTAKSV